MGEQQPKKTDMIKRRDKGSAGRVTIKEKIPDDHQTRETEKPPNG